MVIPASSIPRQELRTTDGEVYAHIIPADELARMQAEMESLRTQLAMAISQRDRHLRQLQEVLREYFPLLPTPEEMNGPWATSADMAMLIAELEAGEGR